MLAFAFAFFGLAIAFISMGFKSLSGKAASHQVDVAWDNRRRFIESIKASPKEIEQSKIFDNIDDVMEDLQYIVGDEIPVGLYQYHAERNHELWYQTKGWRPVISNIRLAKIGKVNDNYVETSGIRVVRGSKTSAGVYRYYEVLARHYGNAGMPMSVVEASIYKDNPNFTEWNLSKFSISDWR